jgi:hypothetical protein
MKNVESFHFFAVVLFGFIPHSPIYLCTFLTSRLVFLRSVEQALCKLTGEVGVEPNKKDSKKV